MTIIWFITFPAPFQIKEHSTCLQFETRMVCFEFEDTLELRVELHIVQLSFTRVKMVHYDEICVV